MMLNFNVCLVLCSIYVYAKVKCLLSHVLVIKLYLGNVCFADTRKETLNSRRRCKTMSKRNSRVREVTNQTSEDLT